MCRSPNPQDRSNPTRINPNTCRGKVDAHVSSIEDLILEIEKLNPDAVEVDMGLYDRIGGIDALNMIRSQLDVNAWFE